MTEKKVNETSREERRRGKTERRREGWDREPTATHLALCLALAIVLLTASGCPKAALVALCEPLANLEAASATVLGP